MGVTIHYRGTVDDLSCVEQLEDRVIDLVFSLGGRATLWRSYADHDHTRVVRGLLVDMAPGQETFSLLISPEGHLTPLFQIEEAEQSPFDEPPYCSVKTQFGSLQGHVAIVHLLDALEQGYCSNLHVSDESEYYETRDFNQLKHKNEFLAGAIQSMADGLREHGLSKEAAEDPSIVASRIERVATLVQQKMLAKGKSASRTGLSMDDSTEEESKSGDIDYGEMSLEEEVETMDQLRRHNDLRSERMARRIAEATAEGLSYEEAFELAMDDEGFGVTADSEAEEFSDSVETNEPWQESLAPNPFDEAAETSSREKHSAVLQAQQLLHDVMDLQTESNFREIASRAAMDIVGGLVQATSDRAHDRMGRALTITQLKRALAGHAFTRGAVFGLRSEDAITQDKSDSPLCANMSETTLKFFKIEGTESLHDRNRQQKS
ncbi:hypothetical protein SH528x_001349 [Novipirellula sp. SH528]|uniref:hypothetical protein n=1 Tax=Novipirellula sp. SH528 TaxID=3454466 RepID=UPI003FA046CA